MFLFTRDIADHRREIERLLPDGTPFDVRRADRSRERLDQIQAAIERDMESLLAQGVDIISVGPHIAGNTVEVGVRDHVKHARELLAQYGEGIVVQLDRPAVIDACTGITNCPRAKAGLAIQADGDNHVCTSGWLGRRWDDAPPHQLVMITAGHCIKYHTNWDGDRGWHLLNGTCIGEAAARYAPKPWVDGANADVGMIPIIDSDCIPETKNYLLLRDDSDLLGRITSERVADPHGNPNITNLQAEGDSLCRIGWGSYDKNRTNPYCGSLWRTNETKETCSPGLTSCVTVKHMQVASFDSSPGDSGGTMFYPNASSGN